MWSLKDWTEPCFSLRVFARRWNRSGAKDLRVCGFDCPDRRRQWNGGGHLHCRAGAAPRWGVLGVQSVWPVGSAAVRRSQRYHQHTGALPVAAHAPRPRPDAHVCGSPPSSAQRLQDPLPAQRAVWVPCERSQANIRYYQLIRLGVFDTNRIIISNKHLSVIHFWRSDLYIYIFI